MDTSKADYAVVTGVQIHNWALNLDDPNSYSMEFVAPASVYAVVNGVATHLDLGQIPQVCIVMTDTVRGDKSGCHCVMSPQIPVTHLDSNDHTLTPTTHPVSSLCHSTCR